MCVYGEKEKEKGGGKIDLLNMYSLLRTMLDILLI